MGETNRVGVMNCINRSAVVITLRSGRKCLMKCLKMHGADREPRPDWTIFTRGSQHPVSKSMEVMEVFAARRFVRPVDNSGASSCPWRVSLCFSFVWSFRFSVGVLSLFLVFLARRKLRGFCLSRAEKGGEKDSKFLENLLNVKMK